MPSKIPEKGNPSLEELAKGFSDKGLFEVAALIRELARLEKEE